MNILSKTKLSILVADSCKKTRLLVHYQLEQSGHNITQISDAYSVHALYSSLSRRQKKPDLVILNHELRQKNGTTALENLLDFDKDIRVVLLDKNNASGNLQQFETNNIKVVSGQPYQSDWNEAFQKTIGSLMNCTNIENGNNHNKNVLPGCNDNIQM